MTPLALCLVLLAAALHATWNFCAKRAGGGLPFVYTVSLVICTLYVPVIAGFWWWRRPELSGAAVLWILGSGVLKTSYSLFLQRGYRSGEFSLIYPLARGTGPLLATIAAVTLLGERPTPLALAGVAAIISSIFVIANGHRLFHSDHAHLRVAIAYGVTTGAIIAAYTIWDRRGVATLAIAPVLYDAGTAFTQLILLTPFAWRQRAEVAWEWREHRHWAFGVALLSPLAYLLVLTAMTLAPVTYVASAREVSIVFGAFIGARVLKESQGPRRVIAAVGMTAGIIALALG